MSTKRRLLVITTTFFPDPQVGAIRMTQWCRHLPQHGWQVHVLCRYYGRECSVEELAAKVHPEVTVEYLDRPSAKSQRSGWLAWARRALRQLLSHPQVSTLAVPDVSVRFWLRQRQQVLERVREIRPDVILTSSPPHSVHDLGLWLAAQTGIPWVADFRDPYLGDTRFQPTGLGRLRWPAHERFMAAIYQRAWLLTHAIPNHFRWARRRYPDATGRMVELRNAFPPEMIETLSEAEGSGDAIKTVLVAGTIPEQKQLRLAEAVALLVAGGGNVCLKLLGRRPACAEQLRALLGERLVLTGYVPHTESVRAVARADVLVNYLNEERSVTRLLSTKLFEYIATGRPVLCVNPSRVERLLLWQMQGVRVLKRPTIGELAEALGTALAGGLQPDPTQLQQFRAQNIWPVRVDRLAEALDRITAYPPAAAPAVTAVVVPVASVVVPTRNRGPLLRRAILSALAQSVPVEVIVMDDGSTDGTPEMVRREFPQVQLHEVGQGRGPCFQRNRGIQLASAEFVFPIDDDSVFSTPHVVAQTLRDFDHPRVAAVGIPFLNPRLDWTLMQRAPDTTGCHLVHAFVGAAHALRRSVFLQVGGFREHFFYMGEEGDLCLRLLNAGYVTRLGRADPVHHMESPQRNLALANRCGRRNDVLFAWHNVAAPWLLPHLLATTFNGFLAGLKTGHLLRMMHGTLEGYSMALRRQVERRPVAPDIYWLHRRLKIQGAALLSEIETLLPPLPEAMEAENRGSTESHALQQDGNFRYNRSFL